MIAVRIYSYFPQLEQGAHSVAGVGWKCLWVYCLGYRHQTVQLSVERVVPGGFGLACSGEWKTMIHVEDKLLRFKEFLDFLGHEVSPWGTSEWTVTPWSIQIDKRTWSCIICTTKRSHMVVLITHMTTFLEQQPILAIGKAT